MVREYRPYLDKAVESPAGAKSEFANGRFNNCANRCYYACFQAAIAALMSAGIRPRRGQWSHEFVPSQFNGVLINRRHVYPAELRDVLGRTYILRQKADYAEDVISRNDADRALQRAQSYLRAIEGDQRP
jgi:uncharacterized protein (UPF0332 family)